MLINRRDITSSKVRPRPGLQPVGGPAAILTPTVTLVQLCLRGNRPPEYLCPFCLLNVPAVIPAVTPPPGYVSNHPAVHLQEPLYNDNHSPAETPKESPLQ